MSRTPRPHTPRTYGTPTSKEETLRIISAHEARLQKEAAQAAQAKDEKEARQKMKADEVQEQNKVAAELAEEAKKKAKKKAKKEAEDDQKIAQTICEQLCKFFVKPRNTDDLKFRFDDPFLYKGGNWGYFIKFTTKFLANSDVTSEDWRHRYEKWSAEQEKNPEYLSYDITGFRKILEFIVRMYYSRTWINNINIESTLKEPNYDAYPIIKHIYGLIKDNDNTKLEPFFNALKKNEAIIVKDIIQPRNQVLAFIEDQGFFLYTPASLAKLRIGTYWMPIIHTYYKKYLKYKNKYLQLKKLAN